MVSVDFRDEDGNIVDGVLPGTNNLREGVVGLTIFGLVVDDDWDCDTISTIMNNYPNKFRRIDVVDSLLFQPSSLALFTTILNKTHCLHLSDCLSYNVQLCQCLQFHHVQDLNLYQCHHLSTDQARHIFDAIQFATSLEKLHIDLSFDEPEEAKVLLLKALKQNRSLKNLSLYLPTTEGDMFFADAVSAIVTGKTVNHLSLGDPIRSDVELPIDALVENLCRKDCVIQSLYLHDSIPVDEHDLLAFLSRLQEASSLRQLELWFEPSEESSDSWINPLVKVLWRNQNLEQLNLGTSRIWDDEVINMVYFPLHLNRAGRRAMAPTCNRLPPGLWPLVLQRAARIMYYKETDAYNKPSLESPRTDVVFWFLKEVIVPVL